MTHSLLVRQLIGLLAACSCAAASAQGVGIPSSTLTPYEIVPQFSSYTGNGPVANGTFTVDGILDFEEDDFVTGGARGAQFIGADISGTLVGGSGAIDLDALWNFEGLLGAAAPNPLAPWEPFVFDGTNTDGWAIRLDVAVLDNWLYAWGTGRPPGDNDPVADYRIGFVAAVRPFADTNEDLLVTAADYAVLRDTGGALSDWRSQYGSPGPDPGLLAIVTAAAASPAIVASTISVPEPTSFAAVVLATIGGAARRPRRDDSR